MKHMPGHTHLFLLFLFVFGNLVKSLSLEELGLGTCNCESWRLMFTLMWLQAKCYVSQVKAIFISICGGPSDCVLCEIDGV